MAVTCETHVGIRSDNEEDREDIVGEDFQYRPDNISMV